MAGTLNITPGIDLPADGSITRQDLEDFLVDAVFGGIAQTHLGSAFSGVTIGASAPSGPITGQTWLDTSGNDNSSGSSSAETPVTLKRYDGTSWVAAANVWISTAAPPTSYQVYGYHWIDLTTQLTRVYMVREGVTGWHPIDTNYQLWTNKSGGTVSAGRIAVTDTGNAAERAFTTGTTVRAMNIAGVLVEDIDNDDSGVLCVVGGSGTCELHVLGSTHGAVAKGDVIGHATTAGAGRQFGPLVQNGYADAEGRQWGLQMGGFAEALEATSSDASITVRMLGKVGSGLHVTFDTEAVGGDADDVQIGAGTSAWGQADLTTNLVDAGHSPIVGAWVKPRLWVEGASAGDNCEGGVDISVSEPTVYREARIEGQSSTQLIEASGYDIWVPTVDDSNSPTGLGETFSHRVEHVDGVETNCTWTTHGYIA